MGQHDGLLMLLLPPLSRTEQLRKVDLRGWESLHSDEISMAVAGAEASRRDVEAAADILPMPSKVLTGRQHCSFV